jgi:hypothetical protein
MISQNLLADYGATSEKMHDIKAIVIFETFLERINTLSYDQRFRSFERCKLGVLLKIPTFWTDQLSGRIWTLSLFPWENRKNSEYKGSREFYNLSNKE